MGRNPTEKPRAKCRKGLWSPDEDERLRSYILRHGHGCWGSLPVKAGIQRNGKSCRLRWINYLRPGLKRGIFTPQEEEIILILHRTLGNKWSQIAQHLPGRTDNDIKNHWHSYLKDKKIESETEEVKEGRQNKPPTTNPVTRVSSFESLVSGEGSSPASTESRQSSLSRLVFTEWLTMDNNISVDHQTSVYLNPNEGFTSDNCFNSEMQGSNVYSRDTPSILCKTNVHDDYDNDNNNNNVGNYMVMNVSNEPEIKLEGDEHDADTLALIGSIFGDEMYNNLFV